MRKIAFGVAAVALIASVSGASAIGGQPHVNGYSDYFFPGIDRQQEPHPGYPLYNGYSAEAPDGMDQGLAPGGMRYDGNR